MQQSVRMSNISARRDADTDEDQYGVMDTNNGPGRLQTSSNYGGDSTVYDKGPPKTWAPE